MKGGNHSKSHVCSRSVGQSENIMMSMMSSKEKKNNRLGGNICNKYDLKGGGGGFPGGAVVKNPPANAGDTGSIPGPGRSHMP